jgi:hypothetical protein
MVSGMQVVTVCNVGMVSRGFLVTACFVLSRFFVMAGRMFMMLRRFCVMLCALFTHKEVLSLRVWLPIVFVSNTLWIAVAPKTTYELPTESTTLDVERVTLKGATVQT